MKKVNKDWILGIYFNFNALPMMWNVFKWSSIISKFTKDYILKTCLKPMMWKGFERMRGFQKVLATANWNLNIGFWSSWMWLMVMMMKNFHQNWPGLLLWLSSIWCWCLSFILYLMLMFIVYLMLGAIKWSMRCLVNMCEQDISIDFCRVRGASCTHALTPSYKYNAALSQWSAVHKQYKKIRQLT